MGRLSALQKSAGEVASLLRAIGNERRLMLLCLLIDQREVAAGELAQSVGLTASATSQHLSKLRAQGVITARRDAQTLYYRIADARVKRVIKLLKELHCE